MTDLDHTTKAPASSLTTVEDGPDVMPLLGLEPANTENTNQNSGKPEDSNPSNCYAPLLGTICTWASKSLGSDGNLRLLTSVLYKRTRLEAGVFLPPPRPQRGLRIRMGIPAELRPSMAGKREIKRSLRLKEREVAKALIPDMTKAAHKLLKQTERTSPLRYLPG